MIPVSEAQQRLIEMVTPLPEESLPLAQSGGRWAARDVLAQRTQPAADLSAMDGYAIRFRELPGAWTLVGESAAGGSLGRALEPGETARIFTGAPMPEGADTVLVQEEALDQGGQITLAGEGPAVLGQNVRPLGSDFRLGDCLIARGNRLTPARVALAAIAGHGMIAVRKKPKIALISTGNELVAPGSPPSDRLPASNAPMQSALLAHQAEVIDYGIVGDDLAAITALLEQAAANADIVVTTGGASVGDHDLVRPAIERAGGTIDFWRVAMRPGKPLISGKIGKALFLGLPGNPVSAFVTAKLFLLPLVAALAGARSPIQKTIVARLGAPLDAVAHRTEFLRGVWRDGTAVALKSQDSAGLVALAEADFLIMRPAHASPANIGDEVEILI